MFIKSTCTPLYLAQVTSPQHSLIDAMMFTKIALCALLGVASCLTVPRRASARSVVRQNAARGSVQMNFFKGAFSNEKFDDAPSAGLSGNNSWCLRLVETSVGASDDRKTYWKST